MAEGTELEVQIIERREIPLPTAEGEPAVEVWITYRYGSLPPGVVRIPKAECTADVEKTRIRADIQRRLAEKPEVLKV